MAENNEQENLKPIDVDQLLDKQSEQTRSKFIKEDKKKFLDINFSWPMLVVVAGGIFGFGFAMQSGTTYGAGFAILYIIIALIAAIILYNIGKMIFASLSGYKVGRIECFGYELIRGKNKSISSYSISNILEFHITYVPKDENANPKNRLMLFGGELFYSLIAIALIVVSVAVPSLGANITKTLMYGALLGFIVVIYEMVPFRLDNYNDTYTAIITSSEEDRKAYNTYLVNYINDRLGLENKVIVYDSYDNSRTKPLNILPKLNQEVYDNKYQEALKTLELVNKYKLNVIPNQQVEAMQEEIYLFLTHSRTKEAEKLMLPLDKKIKSTPDYHPSISSLRCSILISGLLANSEYDLADSILDFNKECKKLGKTPRVEKEIEMAKNSLERIKLAHPDWKFDNITIAE